MTEHEMEANARLIAHSPEMYQALERIEKLSVSIGCPDAINDIASAMLNKANPR